MTTSAIRRWRSSDANATESSLKAGGAEPPVSVRPHDGGSDLGAAADRGIPQSIIHAYDAVDDATVWGIIESHLPDLLQEIEGVLRAEGETL